MIIVCCCCCCTKTQNYIFNHANFDPKRKNLIVKNLRVDGNFEKYVCVCVCVCMCVCVCVCYSLATTTSVMWDNTYYLDFSRILRARLTIV